MLGQLGQDLRTIVLSISWLGPTSVLSRAYIRKLEPHLPHKSKIEKKNVRFWPMWTCVRTFSVHTARLALSLTSGNFGPHFLSAFLAFLLLSFIFYVKKGTRLPRWIPIQSTFFFFNLTGTQQIFPIGLWAPPSVTYIILLVSPDGGGFSFFNSHWMNIWLWPPLNSGQHLQLPLSMLTTNWMCRVVRSGLRFFLLFCFFFAEAPLFIYFKSQRGKGYRPDIYG